MGKLADRAIPHCKTMPIHLYNTAHHGLPDQVNNDKTGKAGMPMKDRNASHRTNYHTTSTETKAPALSAPGHSDTVTEW